MKKKVMTMVLAASMLLGMAGCGSSSANDSAAANGNTAGGDQAVAGTEKNDASGNAEGGSQEGTLTVWCWDSFNVDAMKEAGKLYQKDHPDVNINVVETVSSDIQTLVQTYAMSGELDALPDIFLMDDQVFAKYLQNYPDVFADLTDSGIAFADFAEAKVANSVKDGKNYGVPYDSNTVIACYRKDYLDQAGYTIDDLTDITWSKFMEIGKDVHEKTGKYLLTSEATGGDTLMMMMQSCGANFVNEDGEAYIVGNEVAEKCINLYVDLVKNDVVKLVNNWDEYIATITGGEAAGIVNGNWITATLMSTEDQKGLWQITTMPKVDDVDTATNYANNGGSSWYVTSNCQNVELAEDFLASTFGSSTEFYDTILPEAGAISCYLPAGESKVYNEPNEFFGGQPIFSTIVEYSSHIPEFTKTPYHYESRECVNTAVVNIVNGTPVEDALQEAQDTLAFKMTE